MPHSPFTRYYGFAIVAAYFLALLWPSDHVYLWGWQTMVLLPLVFGIFTWSTVRNAPPFDDLAFHRTLPPGDGFAFRRVIMIHALVLAGIALAVVAYCWVFNFDWRVMSYGILALTMPVWALMAASGIAASLSSSRQWGKTWGYIAMFVVPVFSATLLYSIRSYLDPEVRGNFHFSALRAMTLSGALLYPLVWWLVAVRRRPALGFGLGSAIGALMPWIYIYGGFVKAPERDGWEQSGKSHVTISRKAAIPAKGKWIPVDDVISISGLRPGEFIDHFNFWLRIRDGNVHSLGFYEIPDDPTQADAGAKYIDMMVGRFEGEGIEWGERAVWNHLRKQIPSLETFDYSDQKPDAPMHRAFLRPGESLIQLSHDGKPHEYRPTMTAEEFTSSTWKSSRSVFRMEKVGELDAATGGTCRLPGGGIVKVSKLQQEDRRFSISFRQYYQDLWHADGPWFEAHDVNRNWGSEPWVIAVDESGKHAFALSPLEYVNTLAPKILLGQVLERVFNAGEAKTREEIARMETLRHCKLHVFWPRLVEQLDQEIPPPH